MADLFFMRTILCCRSTDELAAGRITHSAFFAQENPCNIVDVFHRESCSVNYDIYFHPFLETLSSQEGGFAGNTENTSWFQRIVNFLLSLFR